jgi:hypothetical protein
MQSVVAMCSSRSGISLALLTSVKIVVGQDRGEIWGSRMSQEATTSDMTSQNRRGILPIKTRSDYWSGSLESLEENRVGGDVHVGAAAWRTQSQITFEDIAPVGLVSQPKRCVKRSGYCRTGVTGCVSARFGGTSICKMRIARGALYGTDTSAAEPRSST